MKLHTVYLRCLKTILSHRLIVFIFVVWIIIIIRQGLPRSLHIYFGNDSYSYNNVKNTSFKYILLLNDPDYYPFYIFTQKDVFAKNNCSYQNCIVITDRNYFNGNLSKFDAVAINGRFPFSSYFQELNNLSRAELKSLHQKFIYVNTESAENNPVSYSELDGYFNWTLSYKLDSDVPYPYIQIRDISGNVVGPKVDMHWKENMTDVDDDVIRRLKKKTRPAAWFVSNCETRSERELVAILLRGELIKRGYNLDIYGDCGLLECHSNDDCNKRLERYYFYLAFENSLAEDYVSEKLLRALWHYTVPVVYGGANYSRFLPPGSYLDARCTPAPQLANLMITLMDNPHLYRQFFGWRKHYTFHYPMDTDNACGICAALNNPKLMMRTEYPDFKSWWITTVPKCDPNQLQDDDGH